LELLPTVIVHGVVTHVDTRRVPEANHFTVYSYFSIDASEVLNGDVASHIAIRSRGGCLNEKCVFAEGVPYFQRGDEVVLFLQDLTQEHFLTTVYGAAQGQFIVEHDDESGEEYVRNGFGLEVVGVESDTSRLLIGEVSPEHRVSPNPDLKTIRVHGHIEEPSLAGTTEVQATRSMDVQAANARITKEDFLNDIRNRLP
jgi:hypothetical protein